MKNNYNFKINQVPLSKGDIKKHKDFDALMKRMDSVPSSSKNQMKVASKAIYYWIGGIAALLLAGILTFSNFNTFLTDSPSATLAYLAAQSYVNPPIERIAEKPVTIKVNANEGGVYEFPSGSKMVVPKAAFANSYGALIEGEVEIHFKEYHDYVDFFLSGIPMEIKVDGKNQVLESAGMIEVFATQNGERLSILPEKLIDIELKSKIAFAGETPPDFNIYFLDKNKREWSLEGKDEIEIADEMTNTSIFQYRRDSLGNIVETEEAYISVNGDPNDSTFDGTITYDTTYLKTAKSLRTDKYRRLKTLNKKYESQIAQAEKQFEIPKIPQKPEQYDGNSLTFELDFLNPDLGAKNYEGTIFQLNESKMIVDAFGGSYEEKLGEIAATIWEKQDMRKLAEDDFELKLTKGNQSEILRVKPVLIGKDYEKATQQFEKQLVDYQKKKEKLARQLAAKKKEIEARIAIEKEMANKNFEEKIAALKAKGHDNYATNQIVQRTVVNKFQINRFGIWNCDRPRPPYLATLDGTFQDQYFNAYQNTMVYQTDKSQNTLRRFYLKDIAKNVQFNTESENLIWLVTKENKLAVFYPDYFKRIQQKDGEYAFEMDLNAQEINSEEDVRRILKL